LEAEPEFRAAIMAWDSAKRLHVPVEILQEIDGAADAPRESIGRHPAESGHPRRASGRDAAGADDVITRIPLLEPVPTYGRSSEAGLRPEDAAFVK
jgi:hypothetical protein